MKKVFLLILLLLATACNSANSAPQPQPLAGTAPQVQPQGACSQCIGSQCYGAPCNMDCFQHGDWCETFVRGDAEINGLVSSDDSAVFVAQRVMKLNSLMQNAGVEIGDVVTHVDEQFPNGLVSYPSNQPPIIGFANLIAKMRKGMTLRVIKADGTRVLYKL